MKNLEMKYSLEKITQDSNMIGKLSTNGTYEPILMMAKNFNVSSVFDCSDEMKCYIGDVDYHSLMHNVQKTVLTSHKVEPSS